jgi:predicted naringenin-chalcone synthase
MAASILALSSAVPLHIFPQQEVSAKMVDILSITEPLKSKLKQIYENSAIQKRHSVIGDFKNDRSEWHFWGKDFPKTAPSMARRNAVYKLEAPKISFESSLKAIKLWGGNPKDLTHIVFVTCTGVIAPGVEFLLIEKLGLNPSIKRFAINFMGCFGAFKALSLANALAKEDSQNRVLIVCTELCSLHFQAILDSDNLTANAIFSDGSAASIIGTHPKPFEKPLWDIINTSSLAMENSIEKMSWEAGDSGFLMRLSHQVPVHLGRNVKKFTEALLDSHASAKDCDWAIHPGGKSIIQAIEKAMELEDSQSKASWEILAEYGNMSSATFLFVLERLQRQYTKKKWSLGIGFGPGLSFEGILLSKKILI